MKQNQEKNMPEKVFSTGAIQAAIWNNTVEKDGREGSFKTVVLTRRYKDKDDQWKSTPYMRVNDIPRATLVLSKAYEYLVLHEISFENGIRQEAVI